MEKDKNNKKDVSLSKHEQFKDRLREKETLPVNNEEVLITSLISLGKEILDANQVQNVQTKEMTLEFRKRIGGLNKQLKNSLEKLKTPFTPKILKIDRNNPIKNISKEIENLTNKFVEGTNRGLDQLIKLKNDFINRKEEKEIVVIDGVDEREKVKDNKFKESLVDRLTERLKQSQFNLYRMMKDETFIFFRDQQSKNQTLFKTLSKLYDNPVTNGILDRLKELNYNVKKQAKGTFAKLDNLLGGRLTQLFGGLGLDLGKYSGAIGKTFSKLAKVGAVAGIAVSATSNISRINQIKNDPNLTEEQKEEQIKQAKYETGGSIGGGVIGGLIGTMFGPVGTILGATVGDYVGGWLGKSLADIDLKNVWGSIKEAIPKVGAEVANIASSVMETTKDILKGFGGIASTIFDDIKRSFPTGDEFIKLWDSATNYIADIVTSIMDKLPDIFTKLVDLTVDGVTWFIGKIPDLLVTTVKLIGKAIPKLGEFVWSAVKMIGKIVGKLIINLPKYLLKIGGAIGGGVFSIIKSMGGMFVNLIKKMPIYLWDFVKEVPDMIWEGVKSLWDLVVDKFMDVSQRLVIWLDESTSWFDVFKSDDWKRSIEAMRKNVEDREKKQLKENQALLERKEESLSIEKKLQGVKEEEQQFKITPDMLTNAPEIKKPKDNELEFLKESTKVDIKPITSIRSNHLSREYYTYQEKETQIISPMVVNNNSSVVNNETKQQTIRLVNTQNLDVTNAFYNTVRTI